jgi:hypothetical protein
MYGQKMSMVCGDQYLDQPERLYRRIRELRGGPFHLLQLYIWNAKYMVDHARVVEVIERAVQVAHECGLRAGLMIAGNALAELWHPFLLQHPDAFERAVFQLRAVVKGGRIETVAPRVSAFPQMAIKNQWLTWPVYGGVLGAYTQTTDGAWKKVALNDVVAEFQGFHDPELAYLASKGFAHGNLPPAQRRIQAKVELPEGTEVLIYVAWEHRGACDISHPAMIEHFRKTLTAYRHIPLDGIAWDEPIKMAWNEGHALGSCYLDRYRQTYGRDLLDELALLDEDDPQGRHVVVRLAQGRLIGQVVKQLIDTMCATGRELWGQDVAIGNHCTFQGEIATTDLRANGGDYFALDQNMSAAYVDAHWLDIYGGTQRAGSRSPYYTDVLAASMRKYHPSGRCYSMSWGVGKPSEPISFYTRVMAMFRVNWNCFGYGDESGPTPHLFPHDPAWPKAQESARLIEACDRVLGTLERRPSLAVWHGVEGMMGARHWTNHMGKGAYLDLSLAFVDNNVPFDFIPTAAIENAVVGEGCIKAQDDEYATLLIPYAATMTPRMWEQLQAFIAAGVRVVFLGPPPTQLTDGTPILTDFCTLVGTDIEGEGAYWQAFERRYGQLDWTAREPYDFAPLPAVEAERYVYDGDGQRIGVKGIRQNCIYITACNPGESLLAVSQGKQKGGKVADADASMLWQLYEGRDEQALVLCARQGQVLRGDLKFAGRTIRFTGGAGLAMIHLGSQGIARGATDATCMIEADGKPITVERLSSE